MNSKVGVIGLGVVGNALHQVFKEKKVNVIGHDKYKNGGIGLLVAILCSLYPYVAALKTKRLENIKR